MNPNLKALFVLLFLPFLATAGIGLGDWRTKTPGGNYIDNFSGNGYTLHINVCYDGVGGYHAKSVINRVDNLKEWYFYKGCVAGVADDAEEKYFVANEAAGNIALFNTKVKWRHYLDKHSLNPLIWTRWYNDNWMFFGEDRAFIFL